MTRPHVIRSHFYGLAHVMLTYTIVLSSNVTAVAAGMHASTIGYTTLPIKAQLPLVVRERKLRDEEQKLCVADANPWLSDERLVEWNFESEGEETWRVGASLWEV